jgi:hypothetical protein
LEASATSQTFSADDIWVTPRLLRLTPAGRSLARLAEVGTEDRIKQLNEGSAVEYQFLLGKLFWLHNQRYVVSAVGMSNGIPVAHVIARVDDESVLRTFPARYVAQHLICDPATLAS